MVFTLTSCLVSTPVVAGTDIIKVARTLKAKRQPCLAVNVAPFKGKTTTAAIYKSLRAKFVSEPRVTVSIIRTTPSSGGTVHVEVHSDEPVKEVYYFLQGHQAAWEMTWMGNVYPLKKNEIDFDDENAVRGEIHALIDSGLGATHPRVRALTEILKKLGRDKTK